MAVVIHSSSYALGNLHIGAPLNIYEDVVNCILARAKKLIRGQTFSPSSWNISKEIYTGFGVEDRAGLFKVL